MLFALLFVLLRPVCDVFAASGDDHEAGAARQGYAQPSGAAAGGHSDHELCCSSVHADALVVPAIAPLPAAFGAELAAPSGAMHQIFTSVAKPSKIMARRDPAPPLPYHARSLRRLD
jgi:hypothetical protein